MYSQPMVLLSALQRREGCSPPAFSSDLWKCIWCTHRREVIGRPQAYFSKEQIDQWADEAAEEAFAAIRPLLRSADVVVTEHRRTGEPAEVIVEVARACGADAIVMGTHGRGAFLAAVLGSVASRVVATAPVPILLVPKKVESS
ncbi:universal stress protein [Cupriavidus necator]